jgi:uncharacterized membrane protein
MMGVSELVVSVFRDPFRAPEVLNELRRRDFSWLKGRDEAVAVTVDQEGTAKVHLSIDVSRYRAVENARIWAALLGATLFTPALDGIVEVADGIATSSNNHNHKSNGDGHELRSSKIEVQLSDNFRRDVSALMGPNHSAIFMLLRNATLALALEQLRNYGDTIIHTSLGANDDDRMQAPADREKS